MEKIMSFYPSDEYDSSELEREFRSSAHRQFRIWVGRRRRDDDDDDPPPVPAAARPPTPLSPLSDAAAAAA
jgi:hypothetical protein